MATRAGGREFAGNLGRLYGIYIGGFVVFLLLLVILERVGLPTRIIGYVFVFFTLAVYAGIGIVSRTMQVSEYYVAGRRVPPLYNGMATAADWLSGAAFIGLAGTLYALGNDGLAYVLGWTGGFVLVAVLIAPYLRKFGAYTVPDFLAARFGGGLARLLGILVLLCCSFTFVVAQIYAVGIVVSRFIGLPFEVAVWTGLSCILLCSILGGMRAVTWTQVAQYIVLIIAYVAPVVWLSARYYGVPVPQIMYGETLGQIGDLEQQMLSRGLATGEVLNGHLAPFANLGPLNFFGLILCLMLGTASLPHILMRYFTTPSVRDARRSVGWSLLFILLLFCTAPAYAAFAKLEVFQNVIGASLDALPQWIYSYGRIGLVKVCGVDATTIETIREACSRVAGNAGVLRFSDLSIDTDAIVISTPEIAGLPYVIGGLVAAGALAATLSTANGLLLAIANALGHDLYYRMIDPNAPTARRLFAARALLLAVAGLAAYVASTRPADILSVTAWAFSLAAAGNFPALVLGIWWKRCTPAGAVAGIISGFGVTLYYLVATQYGFDLVRDSGDEMALWFGVSNVSAALFGLPVGTIVTVVVSLMTPAPSRDLQALVDEIRKPRGGIVVEERAA